MTDNDTMSGSGAPRLIGARLREARDNTGMSVAEVSRALRIRQVYLQAIEADDYASLPGKTYVLGFLRSYAELLGLDADDVMQHYRRQSEYHSLPQSSLNFPIRDVEQRMPRGAIVVLSLLMAGAAVYGGSRYFAGEEARKVERVAPVPDRLIAGQPPATPSYTPPRLDPSSAYAAQMPADPLDKATIPAASAPADAAPAPQASVPPAVAPAPVAPAAPLAAAPVPATVPAPVAAPVASAPVASAPVVAPAAPPAPPVKQPAGAKPADKPVATATPAPPPAGPSVGQMASLPKVEEPPKPRDVVVVARVDSWIEVRDLNNRPLVSLLLRVGDSYRVPSGANYRLVTGDLRGLEVRVDGVPVPQKGTDDGRLHRTMSLDTDRLRSGAGVVE